MCKYLKLAVFLSVFTGFIGIPALHADWVEDGNAICTIFNNQDTPVIVSDGAGGAIIAWRDNRTLTTNIYAQRVDDDGNILWLPDAMPVCTAPNSQSYPIIIADGSGGAIIAWHDFRSGNVVDLYAQKLNSNGYIQWTVNGVAICTGQMNPQLGQMISDGAGGAIITWFDHRDFTYNVFAQRIGADGTVQWTANGVTISAASGNQMYPSLASDGASGAIIAWQDNRNGFNDIYAQRVDATGNVEWTVNGIVVCAAGQYQSTAQIISDGSGGAIIAWSDHRNTLDYDIYAQRVDADSTLLWPGGGVAISATFYNQMSCRLVPAGTGEAIVIWVDYRSGSDADIYAQLVDASGTPLWTANGIVVCGAADDQFNVQLISDGSKGAVATWEDKRNGTDNIDLYAQRVYDDGTIGWTADGEAICRATGHQTTPQLAPDGWGGAFIAWKDERGANFDIYAQRVDAAGHTVIATLLQNYSVAVSGSDIKIEWTLSEAGEEIDFVILRASEPSMTFSEVSSTGLSRDGLSYSFIDKDCEPATTYLYRVDVLENGERRILFETGPITTPAMELILDQNIPNPFNPSTTISYYVPERCSVVLEVYSISGALIKRLYDGDRSKGLYTVVWHGSDEKGRQMGSGVYFYRLKTGKEVLSRKMILLR